MAETAMSAARDHLFPFIKEAFNLIRGLPKEVADMKDELKRIQAFIQKLDAMDADEDDNTPDGIKRTMKQLIGIAFRMEDVIDEYLISIEQQTHNDTAGCAALCESVVDFIKTMIPRLQIAYKIKDINSDILKIKESNKSDYGFQVQSSLGQGPSGSGGNQNIPWQNFREEAPLYMDEAEIVGFEAPRDELVGWLVEGRAGRTVISIVGMGGLGKTTLAKKVLANKEVIAYFNCHAWFTVSLSYTIEGLLKDMLVEFSEEKDRKEKEEYRKTISTMNRKSLIDEVRNYLKQKRYVLVFDDVWDQFFWDHIQCAILDNKNGSRILITTRDMKVVESCRRTSFVEIHKLSSLSREQSWKLFCKKAFQFQYDGCCPDELKPVSSKIVDKCKGLPLAIVVIGGLLSCKSMTRVDEWEEFSQNLSLELQKHQHLKSIAKILAFSYNNLPYDHLKSCLLYFGVYPEDYEIQTKRLLRQWIAEGFVKHEDGKNLEKVAEQYLKELIDRSLVQVSVLTIDGKVRSCRVHDLTREMILRKSEDLRFCHNVHDESILSGITRRLSIMSSSNDLNGLMSSSESPHIRSLFVFTKEELFEYFERKMPTQYMLLTVLDFEDAKLSFVPENLGNLIHLKYLSFRNTWVESLPNSISKLQNLETLDITGTRVEKMPAEFCKLKKLQRLLLPYPSLNQGKKDIGGMTSLQTLSGLDVGEDGVELIRELGRLTQLRKLSLVGVREEQASTLWSSINNMQHLENLLVDSKDEHDILGSQVNSISLPSLRKLSLGSYSVKLPEWILNLRNLVKLTLFDFLLTDDPMQSLKDLPNLMHLCFQSSYKGVSLHFQDEGFQNLKKLELIFLNNLNSIYIDEGGLPSLKTLGLVSIPKLEMVPSGIQYLKELEVLHVGYMSTEFEENIAPIGGPEHSAIQHVPLVKIYHHGEPPRTLHPSRRYQS